MFGVAASAKPGAAAAQRRLRMGLTAVQAHGHATQVDLWWPRPAGATDNVITAADFPEPPQAEWVAIREIRLVQETLAYEGDDHHYEDQEQDMTKFGKLIGEFADYRRSGRRIIFAVAGDYDGDGDDDLAIFDTQLQEQIRDTVSMLWLNDLSAALNQDMLLTIQQARWEPEARLPEVYSALASAGLLDDGQIALPARAAARRRALLAARFLDQVGAIAHTHLMPDDLLRSISDTVAVGHVLPQQQDRNVWHSYELGDDISGFQRLLTNVFRPFDGVSLKGLQTGDHTCREIKTSIGHMGAQPMPAADGQRLAATISDLAQNLRARAFALT